MPCSTPALPDVSDQQLVAWVREGREDAFGELVRRCQSQVYTLVYRTVRDHDVARELVQDTFVKAFGELAGQGADCKFSAWILKIANNRALDHVRRELRLKRRRLDTVPLEPTPDASSPRKVRAGGLVRHPRLGPPTPASRMP